MAYTSIDDPSAYFQAALYSGTGSAQSITNDGNSNLQPDWMVTKNRTGTTDPMVNDSSRGVGKYMFANRDNAEATSTVDHTSFDSDGFSVSTGESVNDSGDTFVAWQWKANGGTTSSNTAGNVTNTLQANTTAGFSISTFTSASSGNTTFGHGLGVTPAMFILKARNQGYGWWINHKGLSNQSDQYLGFHTSGDVATVSWGAAPTSTLITAAQAFTGAGTSMVCYAFAEIQGYSKFGKYTGSGNADGTFVYTGFKPAFFMSKRTDNTANWLIFDNERSVNLNDNYIYLNSNAAEGTSSSSGVDFLSNGVKMRNTYNDANASSASYIYMAFAHNPFVTSTGIPTTAR
jgi:hypothetical protein